VDTLLKNNVARKLIRVYGAFVRVCWLDPSFGNHLPNQSKVVKTTIVTELKGRPCMVALAEIRSQGNPQLTKLRKASL
jgi:hypothetical protein